MNYTHEILSCLDANISVIDQKGVILNVNRAWENFARERALGDIPYAKVGDNYLGVCQNSFDSGDKSAGVSLKGIRSVLKGDKNKFYQEYPYHSTTEKRWFSMTVRALLPSGKGAVIIHTEISPRKRTEKKSAADAETLERYTREVDKGRERLDDAQLIGGMGSFEWDVKKEKISCSDGLYRIFGYEPQSFEVTKHRFFKIVHPGDRDGVATQLKRMREEKIGVDFRHRIANPKTGIRHIQGAYTPQMDKAGDIERVSGRFRDVTEIKEAKEQLRSLYNELEQKVTERTLQLEQSEAKLRSALDAEVELGELKSRFVAMASHEFRTPLSAIRSSLDILKRYHKMGVSDKQEKHFERIEHSVKNLITILNDFLSLEKMESGEVGIHIEKIELGEYIRDIIKEVRPWAKGKQKVVHEHEGVTEVLIDPDLTRNVLLNLLSNALKYSPEYATVKLMTQNHKRKLVLKVIDTGIGIPTEDQHKMFSRFFRASNAAGIKGTGLGLTIVKHYLDLMGGDISLSSQIGRGTTFTVRIPLA